MKQLLSFITLGVRDLEAMKQFYVEKFGWKTLKDSDGIVFFQMNGFILGLFPADELAKDAKVEPGSGGFKGFTLAINFNSEKEVDDVFSELTSAGVKVVKAPERVFWGGYSGYVADIEENLWEIAFNPLLQLDEDGSVKTHS
jgi:uncharacterized protein